MFPTVLPSAQPSAMHSTAYLQSTGCAGSIHSPAVNRTTPVYNLPLVKLHSQLLHSNTQTESDDD